MDKLNSKLNTVGDKIVRRQPGCTEKEDTKEEKSQI